MSTNSSAGSDAAGIVPSSWMTPEQLARALAPSEAKRTGRQWRTLCPAHLDHEPSLDITERGGKLLLCCRAGCTQDSVIDACRSRHLWPDSTKLKSNGTRHYGAERCAPRRSQRRRIVKTYDYHAADGSLLHQTVRYEPKGFGQRRPDGRGGWIWDLIGLTPVLYLLPSLIAAPKSTMRFLCEGEKDADRLAEQGLIATTNPMGAGSFTADQARYFDGCDVALLIDNDEAGERHAKTVTATLAGIARSLRVIRLPGLDVGGDISNWLDLGGTAEQLKQIAAETQSEAEPPPQIRITAGLRHEAADTGLAAMHQARIPFYQRDRNLVRVCHVKSKGSDGGIVHSPAVTAVSLPMLGRALGQSARWERLEARKLVRMDPPKEIGEQILGMVGDWPFEPLLGVIGTPTIRPDGSLFLDEGYDPATGLVLFAPPTIPSIPLEPTRQDALCALAMLNELLVEFPFANDASRSVALSMMLTPVLRGALSPAVPLHVTTAPAPGTGKSYLQDIASTIAVGDRCSVLSLAPDDPKENEKRLIAAALAQRPIIAIDNISQLLLGDFLCQVTERPLLEIRPLGTSNNVRIANSFTVFANGNNLTIGADQVRRTIQCALDANVEAPEERQFTANPVAMVLADRGRYVAACLTIARAYIVAERPGRLPPTPSYEGWSDLVRSAIVWLNWPDPADTVASVRVEDPIRQARTALFSAWSKELLVGIGYQTADLIKAAELYAGIERAHPALWDAMYAIAAPRSGFQTIDRTVVGQWLSRNQGTIAAGLKLSADRHDVSRPRWKLEPAP